MRRVAGTVRVPRNILLQSRPHTRLPVRPAVRRLRFGVADIIAKGTYTEWILASVKNRNC